MKEVEVPFELPEGWEWTRLLSMSSTIQYGHTASAQKHGNTKLLRITDIQYNSVNWTGVPYCNIDESRLQNLKLVDGDIVIARTGGTVGKSFLIENIFETAVFASYLIRVKPIKLDHSQFIKIFLDSPSYWNQLLKLTGGTGQPNVNATALKSLLLPIPPKIEQKKIIKVIERLFDLVQVIEDEQQSLKQLSEQLKQKVLDTAMQGKLVPQDPNDEPASVLLDKIRAEKQKLYEEGKLKKRDLQDSIIFKGDDNSYYKNVPNSWEIVSLSDIGIITSGGTPRTSVPEFFGGSIPWITPAEMGKKQDVIYFENPEKFITSKGLESSSAQLISSNSIVYSSRAPIGHINIVNFEYSTNQGCKSITPILVDIDFLYFAIKNVKEQIENKASGTTFREISASKFSNIFIALAPINEQIRIAKKINLLTHYFKKIF